MAGVQVTPVFERRKSQRRKSGNSASASEKPFVERRTDRRRSVYAALWCLPSMFVAVAHAGDKVHFEASRAYTSAHVTLRADISKPPGDGPFPAVVLMHGCGGWQPAVRYTMNGYADYLVGKGFVVLALDSFGPRNNGGGKVCESVPQQVDALDYRTYDAYDALNYLKTRTFVNASSIFLMGQSNGGSVAINVAKGDAPHGKTAGEGGYRAVVAYYPWCGSFGNRKVNLASPLLVFGGGQDSWTPAQECQGVRSAGAELDIKIYPEAAHSFDLDIVPQRYLGNLVGLNKVAAEDSRERMVSFFIKHTKNDGWQATRLVKAESLPSGDDGRLMNAGSESVAAGPSIYR